MITAIITTQEAATQLFPRRMIAERYGAEPQVSDVDPPAIVDNANGEASVGKGRAT